MDRSNMIEWRGIGMCDELGASERQDAHGHINLNAYETSLHNRCETAGVAVSAACLRVVCAGACRVRQTVGADAEKSKK